MLRTNVRIAVLLSEKRWSADDLYSHVHRCWQPSMLRSGTARMSRPSKCCFQAVYKALRSMSHEAASRNGREWIPSGRHGSKVHGMTYIQAFHSVHARLFKHPTTCVYPAEPGACHPYSCVHVLFFRPCSIYVHVLLCLGLHICVTASSAGAPSRFGHAPRKWGGNPRQLGRRPSWNRNNEQTAGCVRVMIGYSESF
jgi:hypothetical protein